MLGMVWRYIYNVNNKWVVHYSVIILNNMSTNMINTLRKCKNSNSKLNLNSNLSSNSRDKIKLNNNMKGIQLKVFSWFVNIIIRHILLVVTNLYVSQHNVSIEIRLDKQREKVVTKVSRGGKEINWVKPSELVNLCIYIILEMNRKYFWFINAIFGQYS